MQKKMGGWRREETGDTGRHKRKGRVIMKMGKQEVEEVREGNTNISRRGQKMQEERQRE